MDGAMTDRGFERRQKMVEMLMLIASGGIMLTLIGGAAVVILHFVIKFW